MNNLFIRVPLSYLVDGHIKSGLHFSINFLRSEVTGQEAGAQHAEQAAAAAHPLHT